jgi:predicted transcriptional regulator
MEHRLLVPAVTSFSHVCYRDRVYIIKDIILKLVEYGELNQTALMTFCGLNLSKHRSILEEMERRGLIARETVTTGKRKSISIFRPTQNGMDFCRAILEPYEKAFPRKKVLPNNEEYDEVKSVGM